jgi:serine protease Do
MMQDPLFEMFEQMMNQGAGPSMPQQSLGSGFVIRDDGLILTNNHVVDRADIIKVQISENTKESFDAKIVGKDARTDVALIKIDAKRKLPVVKLGTSNDVQAGEWVAAFGNPYGYGHSITKGIVSALGREIDELNINPFLQVDAPIQPGNSGGPLVNLKGEAIGINTAIDARTAGNIGFAIPIDSVKAILPQLEKEGGIKRGFIGVQMQDIDEEGAQYLKMSQNEGALITQVLSGTPAEAAGIQPYDLVTEFNGQKIESTRDLDKAVANSAVGKSVTVKVVRNGKVKTLGLKVGARSEAKIAKLAPERAGDGGQKAPFNLGFDIADYSSKLQQEFSLPALGQPRPVVVSVTPNSLAAQNGLAPGDVILDVNRSPAAHAKDVVHALKKGAVNVMRVLKQDRVVLVSIRVP